MTECVRRSDESVRDNGQSAALLSVSGLVMYFSVHSETPSRIGKSLITRERGYTFLGFERLSP